MSELTDLEICKRIAEIEGLFNHIYLNRVQVDRNPNESIKNSWINCENYDPITDDALCFQLMVKHSVELSPMFSGCWCATLAKVYTFDEQIDHRLCHSWLDDNPNKAICLAIIEVHKDKS